jgi:hypothetical protein
MSEGSLYDRRIAALAIKQARGDIIEAIFLVRAYRTTLPRFGFAEPLDSASMTLRRAPLPRRHPDDVPARAGARLDRGLRQIAGEEGGAVEVFDLSEAEIAHAPVKGAGIEIASERLPDRRDLRSQGIVEAAHLRFFDRLRRVGVIENNLRSAGKSGELAERGENRLFGQIGRDAEPQHENAPRPVETARLERRRHAAALEVMRHVDDMRRLGDARHSEPPTLVALRRRMIEFENSEAVRAFEPVGERVEPRAEDEDLPHAPPNRDLRGVFGETAAHGHEKPQAPLLRVLPCGVKGVFGVVAENGKRQRVGENNTALERLMRSSSPRRAQRGLACASVLHEARS